MQSAISKQFPAAAARPAGAPVRAVRLAALLVAVLALVALTVAASRRLHERPPTLVEVEPVYLPDVRFLRLASLGYENALADVLWFRTINYFGKHYRGDRLYPWLARMCDVVTDLDPRAEHVYRFAGFILPWEAQLPHEGIRLMEKGVEVFPDSWQLNFYLGFTRYYFLDDVDGALPPIERAAAIPGVHPFVPRFAAALHAQRQGPGAAREFLEELLASGGAAGMEMVIEERLKEIDLGEHIALLESGIAEHRRRFGRPPVALDELVSSGIVAAIPAEPFGDHYLYDAEADEVRSSGGRRRLQIHDSEKRRRILRGESYRDL